jgi:hypothetical protein
MSFFLVVWHVSLQGLFQRVHWPSSLGNLFSRWKFSYSGSFQNKPTFKILWVALPKYICWKIWLMCNKTLFSKEKSHPSSIVGKAISSSLSTSIPKSSKLFPLQPIDTWEVDWFQQFSLSPPPIVLVPSRPAGSFNSLPWSSHSGGILKLGISSISMELRKGTRGGRSRWGTL